MITKKNQNKSIAQLDRKNGLETYVAFLRGINNIGRKTIKMEELKCIFQKSGLSNVRTIQASGNVLFETSKTASSILTKKIEKILEEKLGYKVSVVLRTTSNIQELVDLNPFNQVTITPRTKLLLTFLSEKSNTKLKTPYKSSEKNFKILRVTESEIYSVVTLIPNKPSYRIMSFLEKKFGKRITTRNWNTILKTIKT